MVMVMFRVRVRIRVQIRDMLVLGLLCRLGLG